MSYAYGILIGIALCSCLHSASAGEVMCDYNQTVPVCWCINTRLTCCGTNCYLCCDSLQQCGHPDSSVCVDPEDYSSESDDGYLFPASRLMFMMFGGLVMLGGLGVVAYRRYKVSQHRQQVGQTSSYAPPDTHYAAYPNQFAAPNFSNQQAPVYGIPCAVAPQNPYVPQGEAEADPMNQQMHPAGRGAPAAPPAPVFQNNF